MLFDLVIVGGGAAGFFAGSNLLEVKPDAKVLLVEKTGKILSKVKISGGGRCNVTHNCSDPKLLIQHYPRGNPWLENAFSLFSVTDTLNWFQKRGVKIVAEADGRMFPKSNTSQTIVDALYHGFNQKGGKLMLQDGLLGFRKENENFEIELESGGRILSRFLLISSGGSPSERGFEFLKNTGHSIVSPVPSLFTFNAKPHPWAGLQGLSVPLATVAICDSPFSFSGPVLVTHWGFSGPAILKLSAFGARFLKEKDYQYRFSIDWLPNLSMAEVEKQILEYQIQNLKKKPAQSQIFNLPRRLWDQLCFDSQLDKHFNWAEVGKKKIQVLAGKIKGTLFNGSGKTTYKEEFVTSGGVSLHEVHADTCMSKLIPGLFFAGEVLDLDGITGGFNFQAAWSTAFVATKEISTRLK